MFSQTDIEKYAEVLLWALDVQGPKPLSPGDLAVIHFGLPALDLAEATYALLVDRNIHTAQRMNPTMNMERAFYAAASPNQLTHNLPGQEEFNHKLNASIHLLAPQSLTHLADVNPADLGMAAAAKKPLRDILDVREQKGQYGWTLCLYPTPALAESAGMTLDDYADQVARACYLNMPDPIHEWKLVMKQVRELETWLSAMDIKELHVQSEGVDLTVDPGRLRRWQGLTGHNIPSFEIYTSPDWRGTRGVYYADQPSYRNGNLVRGARLEFDKGRVVQARAEEGGGFLIEQLNMDPGASRLGEFSLTDKRFSRIDRFMAATLFDENYGGEQGNCHVAVGSAYVSCFAGDSAKLTAETREELGFNTSALHWDLVNTEPKTVTAHLADGKKTIIYENGLFTY